MFKTHQQVPRTCVASHTHTTFNPGLIYYDLEDSVDALRSRLNVLFLQ